MLVAVFFWALAAVFDKIAVQNSSPLFYLSALSFFMAVALSIVIKTKSKNIIIQVKKNWFFLLWIAIFSLLMNAFYLLAIKFVLVSYVSAVRSMALLFAIGYGYFVFKEKNIKKRILAASLMVMGVVLLSIA